MKNNKILTLERVSLGLSLMFSINWYSKIVMDIFFEFTKNERTLFLIFSLYGIGLPVFIKIINNLPNTDIRKHKMETLFFLKSIFLFFRFLL